jgi:signal transduction histidine kinase
MADARDHQNLMKPEPTESSLSTSYRYGGAILIAAAALALRMMLASWHSPVHLILYSGGVLASVWLFDLGPGLLTLGICCTLASLNLKPLRDAGIFFTGETLALTVSIATNLAIVLIVARLKAQERRLRSALTEMEGLRRNAEVSRQAAEQDREVAEKANRDKAEYLAIISHELRTPLNAMVLSAAALRRGGKDGAGRSLDRIETAAFALSKMVERLLEFARIENQRLEIARVRFNLGEIVGHQIDLMRPAAETKRIKITAAVSDATDTTIDGDATRIEDAVSNLLTNAIKFTPTDGRVEVALSNSAETVVLRVTDSGAGISPEFLPRVFERFAQDERSLRVNPGLGLGLFIVKHVVELHGGTITASSAGTGKGATFTMTLPKAGADQPSRVKDAS